MRNISRRKLIQLSLLGGIASALGSRSSFGKVLAADADTR